MKTHHVARWTPAGAPPHMTGEDSDSDSEDSDCDSSDSSSDDSESVGSKWHRGMHA